MEELTISPTRPATAIRTTLRAHILENFLFSDDEAALDDGASFQEQHIIDSMGMLQLIGFIETEFGIKVLDEEMLPEKLDSVDRLVAFIREKKGRP